SSPSKKENNHRPAKIELLLDGKRPEVSNDPKKRPTFQRDRHIYKIAPVPALFFYQQLELPTQWHNQREYYKEHGERPIIERENTKKPSYIEIAKEMITLFCIKKNPSNKKPR